MEVLRSLWKWAGLIILVAFFLPLFFEEENLHMASTDHIILGILILFSFSVLLNLWISHHETNFLVSQNYDEKDEHEKPSQRPEEKHTSKISYR
jgi:hypothetical protein